MKSLRGPRGGPLRLACGAALAGLVVSASCGGPPETPPARQVRFEELDLSLRVPGDWEVRDAYVLYAERTGVSESEVRSIPLPDLVRRTGVLLVARPPSSAGASPHCLITVQTEDLSRFPAVNGPEAYAQLAERAAQRNLRAYERLGPDRSVPLGGGVGVRRECRALRPGEGEAQPIRNVTLFIHRGGTGIAVGAYEAEERFEARRGDFEAVLGSVRLGPAEPPPRGWRRLLRWLSGSGG